MVRGYTDQRRSALRRCMGGEGLYGSAQISIRRCVGGEGLYGSGQISIMVYWW